MAFNFKAAPVQNVAEIDSMSESLNHRSHTIKTQTLKTQNIETDEVRTEDVKTEISLEDYSDTFETDDDDFDRYSNSSRQKSNRIKIVKNKASTGVINESDENEYSDTFEELTSRRSSSSTSRSSYEDSRKSSRPMTATVKSNKYTDTFCSDDSTTYESISLKMERVLTLRELTKRLRHKLKHKNNKKKADDNEFNVESIRELTDRLNGVLNKPKEDYSDVINKKYDTCSKVKLSENIAKRIQAKQLIKETKTDYDHKINFYGKDLIHDYFPGQKIDIKKMREELYYRNKCDLVKFKLISEKIDSHEIYYVDSISLIGNLASELPRPTTNPKEIWKKLLEPLEKLKNQ